MAEDKFLEIPEMSADRLTSQLYHLPAIVGRLGLSIANAQKALNADYTSNVRELLDMIMKLLKEKGIKSEAKTILEDLLKQLAPSRYQFTETTLDFSADLSESLDVAGSIGIGAGFGAVVVNAGLSAGFGRDYRAAARIKTILHAIPADDKITQKMLDRADKLSDHGVTLPPRTEVSTAVNNNLGDILKMTDEARGETVEKLASEMPLSPLQRAERASLDAQNYRKAAESFKEKTVAAKEKANEHKKAAEEAKTTADAAKKKAEAEIKAAEGDKTKVAEIVKKAADAEKKSSDEIKKLVQDAENSAADAKKAALNVMTSIKGSEAWAADAEEAAKVDMKDKDLNEATKKRPRPREKKRIWPKNPSNRRSMRVRMQ
ncbi:MAG: hypothetical protein GY859_37235 [Desulfobacterales bacterium]|nr:hypothetical protein [Desulfobacterales bacterium]